MARVAILTESLTGGGVPNAALSTARGLIERGHAVDLLFLKPVCAWSNDDVPDGMRFFYLTPSITAAQLAARRRDINQLKILSGSVIPEPAFVGWQLRQASVALACRLSVPEARARIAFKIAAYLDRERPDALLMMGNKLTREWAAFARCLSRHRPWTVATLNGALRPRGDPRPRTQPLFQQLRRAYSSVDAVVAVSRALARFAVDVVGTSTPVHHVSEPLVDFRALRKAADPVDHPWIGGDVPVVLSVARLEKDYPTLLRAVALLAVRRPVRLIALGEGEVARLYELQALARALGVAGAVDFAGFAANPLAYMARTDLCVLSSTHEGMPQVLVQAMMVGCRMVATDCDFGPAELFAGEEYGRLAPVGDPVRLAEAMDCELDTPRDAARLRARAAELFDVERSIDAYEALLGIGGGGTATVPGRIRPGGDSTRPGATRIRLHGPAVRLRPTVGGAPGDHLVRGVPARRRLRLPIPTLAVMALGLLLVGGAGLPDTASPRWWVGVVGLLLVGLFAAKETILWRWRRDQLREELAGERRRAEQALAAERKRAEQALAAERKRAEQALAAERKRAEQALAAERKRIVASRLTKINADLQARSAATRKQKKPPGDEQNAGVTPRRIAVLTASLAGGGAERVALTIARGLAGRGHSVDLLLGEVKCDYPEEAADAAANNVRFFSVYPDTAGPEAARPHGGGAGRTWRTAIRPKAPDSRIDAPLAAAPLQRPVLESPVPERARLVAAYIDRERPDALLAVNEHEAVSAALARRLARHPVRMVATLNNGIVNDVRIRNFRASYPFVDVAVGVSRGISGLLADVAGVPTGRIRTIHDPVFSPELLEKAVEPVSHPWLGGDVPVVLAAASLLVKKDYPTLLRAFRRLVSRRPARLVALGEGKLLAKLRALTRELGIEGQVDFAGFVRNPFAYMARADLFVLSSRFEGLPGALIQAMATGCPVVSTDCPHGPADILDHGKYGPLVPVGDAAALAEAMGRTLDAPPDADALRSRAAVFSVERAIDAYEALLAGAHGAQ